MPDSSPKSSELQFQLMSYRILYCKRLIAQTDDCAAALEVRLAGPFAHTTNCRSVQQFEFIMLSSYTMLVFNPR